MISDETLKIRPIDFLHKFKFQASISIIQEQAAGFDQAFIVNDINQLTIPFMNFLGK